jgi:hypothetical protein
MALRTDPRFGYVYGWGSGDDGWGDDMGNNLKLLMWLQHQRILDVDLTAPPGSPTIGDTYIPAPTATGDWATHEEDLAIWWQGPSDSSAEWKFFTFDADMEGVSFWLADENEWIVWTGSAWEKKSQWDKLVSRLSVIDRDLTAPPGSPSLEDIYIPAATATGDWAGHEDDIAVWWQEPGAAAAWKFETPSTGLRAFIEDEVVLTVWDGTNWRTGNAVT